MVEKKIVLFGKTCQSNNKNDYEVFINSVFRNTLWFSYRSQFPFIGNSKGKYFDTDCGKIISMGLCLKSVSNDFFWIYHKPNNVS